MACLKPHLRRSLGESPLGRPGVLTLVTSTMRLYKDAALVKRLTPHGSRRRPNGPLTGIKQKVQ